LRDLLSQSRTDDRKAFEGLRALCLRESRER
jgi:hypothetical protein